MVEPCIGEPEGISSEVNGRWLRWGLYAILIITSVTLDSSPANALRYGPCMSAPSLSVPFLENNDRQCSISVQPIDELRDRVAITKPIVTRPEFTYPIDLLPGDEITVTEVRGCVRIGRGSWRRYANPIGPNSHRLYFGSITVPGELTKVRLSGVIGQVIMFGAEERRRLILHYEDNRYIDNTYEPEDFPAHDDTGIANQCLGQGPATVVFEIKHVASRPPRAVRIQPFPPPSLPWDLMIDSPSSVDDNGFMLNPRWVWQNTIPTAPKFPVIGFPELTSQVTGVDNSNVCAAAAFIEPFNPVDERQNAGHLNWLEATYTGTLKWDGYEEGPIGDRDFNIKIFGPRRHSIPGVVTRIPLVGPSYTEGVLFMPGGTNFNPDNIKGEIDSRETVDRFSRGSWNRIRILGELFESDFGAYIDGHDGVMTGLVGLDTHHKNYDYPKSELHPVHALAIRMQKPPDPAFDAWAIFARNFGNEGYCGSSQWYLSRDSIRVRIPRPPEAPRSTIPRLLPDTAFWGHEVRDVGQSFDWVVNTGPGEDAVITFQLNVPTVKSYQYGELLLDWTGGPRRRNPPPVPQMGLATGLASLDDRPPALLGASSQQVTSEGEDS